MTCPHCGLDVRLTDATTKDGTAHAYCAHVAIAQARKSHLTACYKHHVALDETGWCPTCRAWVSRAH